jgi:hypothetical protein
MVAFVHKVGVDAGCLRKAAHLTVRLRLEVITLMHAFASFGRNATMIVVPAGRNARFRNGHDLDWLSRFDECAARRCEHRR